MVAHSLGNQTAAGDARTLFNLEVRLTWGESRRPLPIHRRVTSLYRERKRGELGGAGGRARARPVTNVAGIPRKGTGPRTGGTSRDTGPRTRLWAHSALAFGTDPHLAALCRIQSIRGGSPSAGKLLQVRADRTSHPTCGLPTF